MFLGHVGLKHAIVCPKSTDRKWAILCTEKTLIGESTQHRPQYTQLHGHKKTQSTTNFAKSKAKILSLHWTPGGRGGHTHHRWELYQRSPTPSTRSRRRPSEPLRRKHVGTQPDDAHPQANGHKTRPRRHTGTPEKSCTWHRSLEFAPDSDRGGNTWRTLMVIFWPTGAYK